MGALAAQPEQSCASPRERRNQTTQAVNRLSSYCGYRSKHWQRNLAARLQFRLSFSSVALGESLEAFRGEVSSFISKWLD